VISYGIEGEEWNQGVNIQTGPNGEVYAVWSVCDDPFPSDETALGLARSTDGGLNWSPAARIISGIRGHRATPLGGGKTMRHYSFPSTTVNQQTGEIYVVWTNVGVPGINTGDPDVYMITSTDGGNTWNSPQRLNQDTVGNGKDQWSPWITCDPATGLLACVFYDSRAFSENDMAETWVALSLDRGEAWEDFRVSDVAWSGDGFYGDYAGDYIAIASRNNHVYPIWSDNRSGNMLAYASPFTTSPVLEYPGDGLYLTLQAAIDAAIPGTTVEVDGSRVTESDPEPAIRMKRGVLVRAKPGEPAPVINAQGDFEGVVFPPDSDAHTELSGFLVKNFSGYGIRGAQREDLYQDFPTATITSCTIVGGYIGVFAGEANLIVRDCLIRGQSGSFPTGIDVEDLYHSPPSVVTSEITGNVITSSSTAGCGVYIASQERLFSIIENTIDGWEKGVDLDNLPSGETTVVMRNIAVNASEAGFSKDYGTLDLQHNIAWGNGDNSVAANYEGFSDPLGGGLNLMVDPLLCEKPDQSVEPWALRVDSPAIDPVVGKIGARGIECAWGELAASTTVAAIAVTVLEDLTVPIGLSLTLMPGATLRFDKMDESGGGNYSGKNELLIEGSLNASATGQDSILFTSSADTLAPADWGVVMIGGTASVNLQNAVLEYATDGLVYVSQEPSNTISGCRFRHNLYSDMYVNKFFGTAGPAGTISNCTFEVDECPYGVKMYSTTQALSISNCVFNGTSVALAGLFLWNYSPSVSGGSVRGFSQGSGVLARNNASPTVRNVDISGNQYGLQWKDAAGG